MSGFDHAPGIDDNLDSLVGGLLVIGALVAAAGQPAMFFRPPTTEN